MLRAITGKRYIITLLWRGMPLQYSYTNSPPEPWWEMPVSWLEYD